MQDAVAPPLGQGRYRLIDVLGAGGMAVVYRAYDARLDVTRAVKVLNPAMDDHARIRFFNEARTMAKLHHKHVVTVHDVADDGDRTYLVMELIEGGSVADRMAAFGPLPVKMACRVAIALLDGLDAAHSKGVVHRDVKPHNVLVGEDGVPKVTDFGIASVEDYSGTKTGAVIGTWAYMAPEQRTDAKHVDARADVFGAGCTLYNMVTGVDPFDLYNREAYEEKYAAVPELLRPLIQQSTRYKVDDRFESAAAFRDALVALLPELPDDPEDTPALGIALEERRSEIVPTMIEAQHTRSNPTLSGSPPPPPPPEEEPELISLPWLVGLGGVVLLFLAVGLFAGLLVVAGVVVNQQPDAPAQVEVPRSPPVPSVAKSPPEPVVPTPVQPSPEPAVAEPVAPEPVVPTPVAPKPAVVPRPAPAKPARPVERPRPKASGHVVRFSTKPPGNILVNGEWLSSGASKRYPDGQDLDITFEAGGKQATRMIYVTGPKNVCHDFERNGPCR